MKGAHKHYTQHKDLVHTLLGGGLGFLFFSLTSHHHSPVRKRLPEKSYKNLTILPSIKLVRRQHIIHFHHWMNFLIISLLISRSNKRALKSRVLKGFFIGSILQGLLYKDRFKIIYKQPQLLESLNERK
jgi:hypothetical protein